MGRTSLLFSIVALLLGALLRISLSFQQLWLDEVWTMYFIERFVASWPDVFLSIHHDNNHYLNTLYVWLVGFHRPFFVYRIPAFLCGIGLTAWVTRDAWRRSPREGVMAAVLTGLSSTLIFTSADARGYAPMLLFGYGAFVFWCRWLGNDSWRSMVCYQIFAVLAILSHLTALAALASLISLTMLSKTRERGWREGILATSIVHSTPVALVLALFWVDLRFLTFGGARELPHGFAGVVHTLIGWTEPVGSLSVIVALAAVALAVAAFHHVQRSDEVALFVAFLGFSAVYVVGFLLARNVALHERLLYVVFLATLVAVVRFAADLWRERPRARALIGCCLGAFVLLNLQATAEQLRSRNGDPEGILHWVVEHAESPTVSLSTLSTVDYSLVRYYARRMPHATFVGVPHERWAQEPPDWILERPCVCPSVNEAFREVTADRYERVLPAEKGRFWAVWRRI
jgi:hypothetical protein